MSYLWREDSNATSVQIFKSHDDHRDFIQGQFLFQVSDYMKVDGEMTPVKRLMLAPVPFRISPSKFSSRIGVHELVYYSVLDSKSFSDVTILAEKITAKIMSRFRFTTNTTSCSNIIIAANVDRIYTIDFNVQNFEFDHGDVSSSFGLHISENDEEDMDAGASNDDEESENNEEYMDDVDNDESENNEEFMDDGDGNEHYNGFSRFEENYFSDIKGFSEVTGLVNVKPDEVSISMDCCSICLEEFGTDYSGVVKAETQVCSHMFHGDCIHPWLRKFSNSCPLCRSVFIAQI